MVYPGPAEDLKAHAKEFLEMKGKQWPKDFTFVLDPDYTMVNAYGLRWDAPRETAYPSTFVLDKNGVVRFEKISHSHGGRAKAADVLEQLKDLAAMNHPFQETAWSSYGSTIRVIQTLTPVSS